MVSQSDLREVHRYSRYEITNFDNLGQDLLVSAISYLWMTSKKNPPGKKRRTVLKAVAASGTAGLLAGENVQVKAAQNPDKINSKEVDFGIISIGASDNDLEFNEICSAKEWPLAVPRTKKGYKNHPTSDIFIPKFNRIMSQSSDTQPVLATDRGLISGATGIIHTQTLPAEVTDLLAGMHFGVEPDPIKYRFDDGLVAIINNDIYEVKNNVIVGNSKIQNNGNDVDIDVKVEHWGKCRLISHPEQSLIPKRKDTESFVASKHSQREVASNRRHRPEIVAHEYENESAYGLEVRWE